MNAVVPWARRSGMIVPHYPKAGPAGRLPTDAAEDDVAGLQSLYALIDPMDEEGLY